MGITTHFIGTPFTTKINGEQKEVAPFVYSNFESGVGIKVGKEAIVWGLVIPQNLIAFWRATEILKQLEEIDNASLSYPYYTAIRNPSPSDYNTYVKPTIEKIGAEEYQMIMSLAIPDSIIGSIISSQENDIIGIETWPITDEVRAENLEWQDTFADAGILHPSQVDFLKKNKAMLDSYLDKDNLTKDEGCFYREEVRKVFLSLQSNNMDEKHPSTVLVALAVYITNRKRGFDVAVKQPAKWLSANSSVKWWEFWKNRQNYLSRRGAKKLLLNLALQHDRMNYLTIFKHF